MPKYFILGLIGLFIVSAVQAQGSDYIVFPSPLLPTEPLPDDDPESTAPAPSPYGVEDWDGLCAEAGLWFGFGFVPEEEEGDGLDYRALVLYDGNGNPLSSVWRRRGAFPGAPAYVGDGLFRLTGITATPVTLRMYDIPDAPRGNLADWVGTYGEQVAAFTIDPTRYIPDCAKLPTTDALRSLDDRRIGELGNSGAVYAEDGNIVVYGINDGSQGYTTVTVDTTELSATPEENTLLASSEDGLYNVYHLTTGQYQVNIGPNAKGEVRVLIFNNLNGDIVEQYNFNVYDILGGE